jgi:hypothetical protein
MKETFQIIGVILLVLLVMFGLGWAIQGNSFFMYKYFAPKQAQVQREVFVQTQSFKQGVINEISGYQRDYLDGTKTQKKALGTQIIRISRQIPITDFPQDLQDFIAQVKNDQLTLREKN